MRPQQRENVRRASRLFAAAVLSFTLLANVTPPADALPYTVPGTCGVWTPWGDTSGYVTEYPACPELWARNVGGSFATPNGIGGGWRFDPPDGTSVAQVDLQGSLQGLYGWEASAYTLGTSARVFVGCPGLTCPGSSAGFAGGYPAFNSGPVILNVRCGASACSNGALGGQIYVSNASVTLNDYGLPTGRLTGGSLLSGGWKSGTQTVVVDGSDNIGIQSVRALIDGVPVASATRSCSFGQKVPCSNGATEVRVPTNGLSDGPHDVAAQVVDGSGNVTTTGGSTFSVDTVAPTAPLDVAAAGGVGWRANNKFAITWRNPPQNAAPIAAVRYTLCPDVPSGSTADARSKLLAQCTTGSRSKRDLTSIDDLELPKTGQWDLKLWLVDAAGNEQATKAAELDGLGFDDAPPSAAGFTPPTPDDPTRVHMQAVDSLSGVAGGSVEVRRDGQTAWQPLPTDVTAAGLSAVVDDETLPKGLYFLRARVTDAAGLEASNDRTTTGDPATIKLPIRLASSLATGRRGKRICRGHGTHRTCRNKLVRKPLIRVGRSTRLYGRLMVAGTAMPGAAIEIWSQLKLAGAPWVRLGTATTSRTGRFSYLAGRGPARSIRFRYPGTPTVRGRNGDVALRVRASSTLRPSRRNVVNGEYVTFRGRLAGGWVPPSGALVELQVLSRGQWRTFAQPRASAKTGRFVYRYRFETVRGRASFKFRARIRQQPGFPFVTGTSRAVRVRVRGL